MKAISTNNQSAWDTDIGIIEKLKTNTNLIHSSGNAAQSWAIPAKTGHLMSHCPEGRF